METSSKRFDYLWIFLFAIVFLNGFEAGGYQASLWNIGQNYDLSVTKMGLFASTELFATMLAPLVLGSWADKNVKTNCIMLLLGIQLVASTLILFTDAQWFFIFGVFFLGLTTSALQFISIAALADSYPITGGKKIGYMTSMYAFGALTSPIIVDNYLKHGLPWRTLFALLAVGSLISFVGIIKARDTTCEIYEAGKRADFGDKESSSSNEASGSHFFIYGIFLLCVIMCIYVGFENGFAFFVDTFFTDVLKSDIGKYALSLFWAVMIPSRVLVGHFAHHARKILITATVAIPVFTVALSLLNNSTLVLILCIPLGFACGAIYPCVLNMMLPLAGKKTGTATGMITTATGIGGFVFTALTGYMGEKMGISTALQVLSAFFIISLISAIYACSLNAKILANK